MLARPVDLVVERDEGGAELPESGGVGEALEGHVGVAREDAVDLGAGFGAQGVHPIFPGRSRWDRE